MDPEPDLCAHCGAPIYETVMLGPMHREGPRSWKYCEVQPGPPMALRATFKVPPHTAACGRLSSLVTMINHFGSHDPAMIAGCDCRCHHG